MRPPLTLRLSELKVRLTAKSLVSRCTEEGVAVRKGNYIEMGITNPFGLCYCDFRRRLFHI
jgi:hypothetical protein